MEEKQKLPVQLSLSDLHEDLVFTRFGELAKKRDELYADFIEIDEPDEIGSTWVNFSGLVVNDLLAVVNLTRSLFERLVDELRRSQEEPTPDELSRIRNLTSFWLDLSIMSYLYSTLEKRGVLGQSGTNRYSLGYVETKKSIDDLTLLAFQAGQEFFNLESRISLGETLSLNLHKKRLDFLDDMSDVEEMKNQILGEYDMNQAKFLMNRVWTRLLESADSWWFMDNIAMNSASEHAISHIKSVRDYWSHCTSDLVEKGNSFYDEHYLIAKLSSDFALAQHYRKLAMAALQTRATSTASEYFGQAAELTASIGLENLSKIDELELWKPSIPQEYLIFTQMHHLSKIASYYQSIVKYMVEEKVQEIDILIPEILTTISDMLAEGDIAYVSSVAVAYETVFEYIQEQLALGTDVENIIRFVEKRLVSVGERLQKASHQITVNWIQVISQQNFNIKTLNDVIANIDYPLMAIYILPPDSNIVEDVSNELTALKLVTEALNVSYESEKEFGKNPVKEMLMRAKTFELTHEAINLIDKVKDEETSTAVRRILEPVAQNAFLRGLIAEIQLRTAVLQYRYINRVAPLIENSSLREKKKKDESLNDEEELQSFITDLNELNIAASEVQKYKLPIKIGGAPLNWGYLQKLEYYSSGLVKIVKSVNHAIQASKTAKNEVEDAVLNWDEAKTLAFDAADVIAKGNSGDAESLSQQVYSLAQLYYDYENKRRDRKSLDPFPVDGIVELISSLLMGL